MRRARKRYRKPRPQERESEVTVNIREVLAQAAPVAFIVSEYDRGLRKVRYYNGKLWRQAQDRQPQYMNTKKRDENRPFWLNQTAALCNWQWLISPSCNWQCTLQQHKENAAKRAANHIIVEGEVYERTGEPYYSAVCFGLGCNHGGTGFFIEWADYRDRKAIWGMAATDKHTAIEKGVQIALNRGDTESVSHIRQTCCDIKVLMPETIRRKYAKDY